MKTLAALAFGNDDGNHTSGCLAANKGLARNNLALLWPVLVRWRSANNDLDRAGRALASFIYHLDFALDQPVIGDDIGID